jgi:hypothetical protein
MFLLGEDKALREKLQGLVVHDQKADGEDTPRQVGVWFGQPDQELRTQNDPYITIDMIDINHDNEREMRGKTNVPYLTPPQITLGANETYETDIPIPVTLDYQITTYSRHPRHDRELIATLMYSKLPFRFGTLEIPTGINDTQGNPITTMRRLDVIDISKRDVVEAGKRLFMNAITVRVSSEIPQDTYRKITKVQQVNIDAPELTRVDGFIGIDQITIP